MREFHAFCVKFTQAIPLNIPINELDHCLGVGLAVPPTR